MVEPSWSHPGPSWSHPGAITQGVQIQAVGYKTFVFYSQDYGFSQNKQKRSVEIEKSCLYTTPREGAYLLEIAQGKRSTLFFWRLGAVQNAQHLQAISTHKKSSITLHLNNFGGESMV